MNGPPASERAKGKWRAILPQLGIPTDALSGKHGPCPACGGKDRFRFDDKGGTGGFYCSGCGAGDGFALLMRTHGWTFAQAAQAIEEIVDGVVAQPERPGISADAANDARRRLWNSTRRIAEGDEVSRYLASRRLRDPAVSDLRIVPGCPVRGHPTATHLTAMVAMVRAPDGLPATIHRTYLEDGGKADMGSPRKLMAGGLPKGSAIHLARPGETLAVAEGIETALAVTRDFGLPCWSLINADNLAAFEWPEAVRRLEIFADNDPAFAGQACAYALARRARRGRDPLSAEVHVPPETGVDWLDVGNAALVAKEMVNG